jgi:branched-chain amino acid transport system substrate-binding protein
MMTVAAAAIGVASGAARAQDTIRLGALFETSGFLAMLGNQGLEGATLGVEQVNAAGGVLGKKLELINVNTESDETKAVIGAKRLLEREKIVALIGAMNSGSTFSIIDTVQRAGIPIVSNGASRAIATPVEQKKWVFLAPLTDVLVIGVILDHMKKHGISKIALVNSDSGFATSGRTQWERLAPERGIAIVLQRTFGNNDSDMTPQLTQVRGSDAQATVVWTTGKAQSIVAQNYRQLGIKLPLYYSHSASDPNLIKLGGDAANGIVFPTSKISDAAALPDSDSQKKVIAKFVADFTAKYGREPATFAGNGYDSVMLLANAIQRANSLDPEKIRDALERTKDHPGVTAVYTYSQTDHFGAQASSVLLHVIKDGRVQLLKE